MTHDFDQLLQSAAYAGQLLLESGAEIYRVEDTICRICLLLKFDRRFAA